MIADNTIFLGDYNCITSIKTDLYNFICQKVVLRSLVAVVSQEDVPIIPVSVTLRLAPMPRFDHVSAFTLEDQYTSNTISSHVNTTVSFNLWDYL
jgi:hypothetical protein